MSYVSNLEERVEAAVGQYEATAHTTGLSPMEWWERNPLMQEVLAFERKQLRKQDKGNK
jgi:hypothetical protein